MRLDRSLNGRRVLIAEDEFFIAADMARIFEDTGAVVVGPAGTVGEALQLVRTNGRLDGAVLDINLNGEAVYPVADELEARNVPFLFATGYDPDIIPARYSHIERCEKPLGLDTIPAALFFGAPCKA